MTRKAQKHSQPGEPTRKDKGLDLFRLLSETSPCDQAATDKVYDAAHDASSTLEIRALLFLLYGARIAAQEPIPKQPRIGESDGWLRRAYYFGLKYGLPPQPIMVARILACQDGLDLAVAYVRECDAAPVFKIKEELGLALLDSGMDASGLISLCRALHAIEPLAERLLDASEEISLILPSMRHVEEPEAIMLRRDQVDRLAALIGDYMLRTRSTKVVILLAGFINTMLATAPLTSGLVARIEGALNEFLEFDDSMLADCLKIEFDQDRGKVVSPMKEVMEILKRQDKA
jgi:hypothetical protein